MIDNDAMRFKKKRHYVALKFNNIEPRIKRVNIKLNRKTSRLG